MKQKGSFIWKCLEFPAYSLRATASLSALLSLKGLHTEAKLLHSSDNDPSQTYRCSEVKRESDPTVGLNMRVITHLSDDIAQTLCKYLFLSKFRVKVW